MSQSESLNAEQRLRSQRFTLLDGVVAVTAFAAFAVLVVLFMAKERSQPLVVGLVLVWSCCWGVFLARGIRARDLVRIVFGAGFLLLLTCPAALLLSVSAARSSASRAECALNLKRIALALDNYEAIYRTYPPAYIADENGRPMHSWRVLILPFLEYKHIYDQYDFSEPWDGPHNSRLLVMMPECYRCGAPSAAQPTTLTSYFAVVGSETAWPGVTSHLRSDFTDGLDKTIFVVESEDAVVPWMKPEDLRFEQVVEQVDPHPTAGISSHHPPGAAHVVLVDGTVLLLPNDTLAEQLRALLTISGGESVSLD